MLKLSRPSGALCALSCILAFVSVACVNGNPTGSESEPARPVSPSIKEVTPLANPIPSSLPSISAASTAVNTYERALDNAESANTISQSARSSDDWNLVVSRWQEAIALLKAVPASSPYYAIAKNKILEYQHRLAYARSQAIHPNLNSSLPVTVVEAPTPQSLAPRRIVKPVAPLPEAATATPNIAPANAVNIWVPPSPARRVFQAPIKRRQDGIPVIDVTFNGTQKFEMIVDTGASGTLITQEMGEALSLVPVGKAKARTASGEVVEFPLGSVKSIEAGGTVAKDMVVAIGGPEVEMGLLGHDFFGNYDVTIKQDAIEFRER